MWPFSSPYPELRPADVAQPVDSPKTSSKVQEYDYIIVGGGTAGCVLAARLSEDPNVTVLLLERGDARDTWANRVPLISGDMFKKDSIARPWPSMPIPGANNRQVTILQGEALGGGSRVNAMIYTRGTPGEYQLWEQMGHPTWNYESMKPYFMKSENSLSQPASDYRGKTGPWENQTFMDWPWTFLRYIKEASGNLGVPFVPDYNSPTVPAVSCAALDIATDRNMHRCSTFAAFLPQSVADARKAHLKICTGAVATRIIFDEVSGKLPRATGVEFQDRNAGENSATFIAKAKREVIVCCGALTSPQLLMLSGIGPAAHLKEHKIPVVLDNAGVGECLKDHVDLPVMWHSPLEDSMHVLIKKPLRAMWELAKYVTVGKGLFRDPFVHFALFLPTRLLNENSEVTTTDPRDLDSSLPENRPDIEVKPLAVQGKDPDPTFIFPDGVFTLLISLLKPASSGNIRLASPSAWDRPQCYLNLLAEHQDIVAMTKGVRLALRLVDQARAQGYPFRDFVLPQSESDKDIEAYVRENARTVYHYSSTCRMAPFEGDIPGVVDDELQVYGIDGLRVCDASVFPEVPASHTMAPVVAAAEKCADMIKTKYGNKI